MLGRKMSLEGFVNKMSIIFLISCQFVRRSKCIDLKMRIIFRNIFSSNLSIESI